MLTQQHGTNENSSTSNFIIISCDQYNNMMFAIGELTKKVDSVKAIFEEEHGERKIYLKDVAQRLHYLTIKPIQKRIELGIFPKPHMSDDQKPYYKESDMLVLKNNMKQSVRKSFMC